MLSRVVAGGVAGTLATVPQSAVVWGMRFFGGYRRRPAPERVVEGVAAPVGDVRALPPWQGWGVKAAGHFGFGGAAGAAFGLLSTWVRPTSAAGVLWGLAVWKASYDGWIPRLRIMPPIQSDERGRVRAMVLAHIVWGLVLASIYRRLVGPDPSHTGGPR